MKPPKEKEKYLPFKKILFWKIPDGWQDLGLVKKTSDIVDGDTRILTYVCTVCNDRVRVGKLQGQLFHYCKRCGKIYRTP